jgi:hypothetical protein
MQRNGLHGNILNQYEWGEYLIWHVGNDSRVFIDGRCELVYPDKLIRQYAIFFYGLEGAQNVLDTYPHDFVLIGPHTRAYDVVRQDVRWHLLYSDATAALFARASLPVEAPTGGKLADSYFP